MLKMNKTAILLVLAFFFVAGGGFLPQIVQADVEWRIIKDLHLETSPLDITPSNDGKWLYILTPGEILIFSISEGTISDRIPVDKDFDRIAPLPRPGFFTITSSTKKTLQVILFETIYKIDLTDLPFRGPKDALVTVAVFDDYQWPYCGGLEPLLQQVLEKYPNDVKLVIKHFPLQIHNYARKAAIAALAAGKQGKFWEAHEKLFANQNDLNDTKVEAIAGELGLDMEKFKKDLQDPAIASIIDRDMNDGLKANVQGTPSIFINGKLLNQRNYLLQAVEAALKKKK